MIHLAVNKLELSGQSTYSDKKNPQLSLSKW